MTQLFAFSVSTKAFNSTGVVCFFALLASSSLLRLDPHSSVLGCGGAM